MELKDEKPIILLETYKKIDEFVKFLDKEEVIAKNTEQQ